MTFINTREITEDIPCSDRPQRCRNVSEDVTRLRQLRQFLSRSGGQDEQPLSVLSRSKLLAWRTP